MMSPERIHVDSCTERQTDVDAEEWIGRSNRILIVFRFPRDVVAFVALATIESMQNVDATP